MKKWLLVLIIIAGAYAVLSGEFLIEGKGTFLAFVRESLSAEGEKDYLREKNQSLEIELLNLKKGNPETGERKGTEAKVFSVYPYADRSELTLNAGSEKGISEGDIVLLGNALVGQIKEVRKRTSIAQTVFDPEFEIPVRIGEAETDALYIGGMDPKLKMIDSDKPIPPGEIIVSAASSLPYGLGIGRTLQVSEGLLKEASVEPMFEIKNLRNVLIVSH
ncbi:MAG: rod shape-determining protein MreC [Parcubacteria group bacterium]